jgi:signal transduction histidine kinase
MSPEIKAAQSQHIGEGRIGDTRQVSPFSARRYLFADFPAELEYPFRQHYNASSAPVAWIAGCLGLVLILVFHFWDRIIDSAHAGQTLMVRVVDAVLFVMILLIPRPYFARFLQLWTTSGVIAAGIGVAIIISLLQDGLMVGISGIMLVLMFNFGFLRLLFGPSLASGLVICIGYNVVAIAGGLEFSLVIANNFFFVSALFSGASVAYLLERLFREAFLADRALAQEREALARQHQIDARYLDWLRHLASFLRHEVRQPVAQINLSIELIKLTVGDARLAEPHILSASQSVTHVWNLIERASRATDAEAFVRQSQPVAVNVAELLREVVDGFRQTYSGIAIGLTVGESTPINIDPSHLKEAVVNLLANAVSFADENTTVEVLLQRATAYLTVKIRNRGPLIEVDPEVLFGPFSTTRSRSRASAEHQGLGLYLVRLIAEYNGGKATISNLQDESGVEASIWLPLPS